jgi:transcriptional regulator with XRE-family HTH domain
LLDILSACVDNHCGTQDVVDKGQSESLADFVRRIRHERRLSLEEVERRAGHRIGRTYINRIEIGESTNPSPRKLQALAIGLGVLEEELFARVRGVVRSELDSLEEELLTKYRQLPPDWQKDLIGILDVLHKEHVKPAAEKKAVRKPRAKRHAA